MNSQILKRTLGRTGLLVSEIGFAIIIQETHQYGVNFVDTGIVYTKS